MYLYKQPACRPLFAAEQRLPAPASRLDVPQTALRRAGIGSCTYSASSTVKKELKMDEPWRQGRNPRPKSPEGDAGSEARDKSKKR